MAEEDTSNSELAKERLEGLAGEVQTKGIYIGLALFYAANAANVFAASIPGGIFVVLFLLAVGIDAYN